MEKTTTTNNIQFHFRYIITAVTKTCSIRRLILSHFLMRFAYSSMSAILVVSSLLSIPNNENTTKGNSKTDSGIDIRHTRDRFEALIPILEAAKNGGIKKFDLFYMVYLDPAGFHANLQLLMQGRLLVREEYRGRDDSNCYYRTTNRGFMFLELYRELERLCPSLKIYVNN